MLDFRELYLQNLFPAISWVFFHKVNTGSTYLLMPIFALFLQSMFENEIKIKHILAFQVIGVLFFIIVVIAPANIYSFTNTPNSILVLLFIIYSVFPLVLASKNNREGARIIIFGYFFISISVVNDILIDEHIIRNIRLLYFAMYVFVFMQAIILARKFSKAFSTMQLQKEQLIVKESELRNYQDHLEDLVKERTGELQISNEKLKKNEHEIKRLNKKLELKVADKSEKLEYAHSKIIKQEHKSELADITSGTLHNVKNLITSVKTSSESIGHILKGSIFSRYKKANKLLGENIDTIEDFITNNPKGKKLMEYYLKLEEELDLEAEVSEQHLNRVAEKIDAIEQIINAQQAYGGSASMAEEIEVEAIVEDALTMQMESLKSYKIEVTKKIQENLKITVFKTKFMHILINLFKNAIEAMLGNHIKNRSLTIFTETENSDVLIGIKDAGHGISPENLEKMFSHGFTTKEDGHGFGLHSSMNYIREMGGEMTVQSEGNGKGATFLIRFPVSDDTKETITLS